jgi:hypothetical protein
MTSKSSIHEEDKLSGIESLIENNSLMSYFAEYLTNKHNAELLLFIQCIRSFKKMGNDADRYHLARKIISQFFDEDAKYELNLDCNTRESMISKVEQESCIYNCMPDIFDQVYAVILGDVKSNHFNDFLKSKQYKRYEERRVIV